MEKIMKLSTIKKIVARVNAKVTFEFEIDSDVYEDVYFEAATRAIERIRNDPYAVIRPVIDCVEKKEERVPEGHVLCNSYWVLVNAALYKKAERLREKFMVQFDKDLKKEPLRGSQRTKSK